MTVAELVDALLAMGVAIEVDGEALRYHAPRGAMTPEVKRAMRENKAELLELLRSDEAASSMPPRVLAGHRLEKVVWETEKAVIFEDEYGLCWRYLRSWGQAWPVIISERGSRRRRVS